MTNQIRVIVVYDRIRDTVHGMTCDDNEARQWCRDLAARHGYERDVARQYVGLVTPTAGETP